MKNKIIKKTLKNGIKLYLYIDKTMKRVLVDFAIHYGSGGENFDFYLNDKHHHVLPGCAHFLEHLLLEHSKYGNLYQKFASKKYEKNGMTGMKLTHYYFIGIDDIKESIKELITAIEEPVFTKKDVVKTSEAIISETRMVRDNKVRLARSIVERNLYKEIELIDETLCSIGNEETTKKIDYEMLKTCYEAFYTDDNKMILVAGNIDEEDITKYIESIYEKIPKHENKRKAFEYKIGGIRKKEEIIYMPMENDYTLIGFRNQRPKDFTEKEMLYYLDFILESKFLSDSKFTEDYKKNNIICSNIDQGKYFNNFAIHLYLSAYCKDSHLFIEGILNELKTNNLDENLFELYKRKTIANEFYISDHKYNILKNFLYNVEFSEELNDIKFIKSLTFDKCIKFYKSLSFDTYSISILRNNKDK